MSQKFILAIDVGNTNTSLGLFSGKKLYKSFRLKTDRGRTADEMGGILHALCLKEGLNASQIKGTIIASVVPPLRHELQTLCTDYLGSDPLFVEPGIKSGIKILYENPYDVGADRIINCAAACELYGTPLIVVDFGTATTFDCVNVSMEYLGGVIAPGIDISSEALFLKAARLPRVTTEKPEAVIGRNTVGSIQSGLFYGYVGLVEGILSRISSEMEGEPKKVATGWLGREICTELNTIDAFELHLSLQGLQILYEKNKPQGRH
ncbi:type III pantothenate kinase [Acidobacteriota bacterium]